MSELKTLLAKVLAITTLVFAVADYPDIEFEDRIVDNMCMQLVQKPELYEVIVLPNLYGDIVSDLAAGLIGGLGVAPGANLGEEYAVFEPVHGSAPKYKGLNKINPLAMILSGVMMLRHLGEFAAADRLEQAVASVIAEGKDVTYDLKPKPDDPTAASTSGMADAIIARMIVTRNMESDSSSREKPPFTKLHSKIQATSPVTLRSGEIIDPPTIFKGLKKKYFTGIGKKDDRIIILLNLDFLLSSEEKIILKESEEMLEEHARTGDSD